MPNEIYHRSEWGNPKAEGFGDVYFDASATNKLYKHSDYYENSDGTDKILRDIPNKASIVLTPTAYSDGSLNTVIPTDGNGDFDFSRGSSATRVNEQGLIEDVASNIPRIDYTSGQGALLLEPQRTNLITYSEDFNSSIYNKNGASVTDNDAISPEGVQNATKFEGDGTDANVRLFDNLTFPSTGDFMFSVFAKAGTNDFLRLNIGGVNGAQNGYFDLRNGTTPQSWAKIEPVGIDDWYRISITTDLTGPDLTGNINFYLASSIDTSPFPSAGDANGQYVYLYGAQLEQGSYATSYIPTEGSTVTRSADVANNSGNADLFNDSEGVLYAEIAALANDGTFRVLGFDDNTSANNVNIFYRTDDNRITFRLKSQGSQVIFEHFDVGNALEFHKVAFKYKSGQSNVYIDGVLKNTYSTTSMPVGLKNLVFEENTNGLNFYGKTKELAVFKEALTDAELESLTSWISFVEMATDLEYTLE